MRELLCYWCLFFFLCHARGPIYRCPLSLSFLIKEILSLTRHALAWRICPIAKSCSAIWTFETSGTFRMWLVGTARAWDTGTQSLKSKLSSTTKLWEKNYKNLDDDVICSISYESTGVLFIRFGAFRVLRLSSHRKTTHFYNKKRQKSSNNFFRTKYYRYAFS